MRIIKKIMITVLIIAMTFMYVPITNISVAVVANYITLKQKDCTIAVGTSLQLNATITPTNTTNKTITWSSSNTSIATINKYGVVKGIKPGTVTIYAKTSNNKTATCIIRVNIPPKSISLNKTALTLNKGNRATLLVNFNPTNTTSKEVNWKSSNPNVVSVSNATTINSQITVIAKARGTAIITATHKYGKTAICRITVNEVSAKSGTTIKKSSSIVVNAITLKQKDCTIAVGTSLQLNATITPTNATNKTITWSSSNTSIATINKYGVVKGIKPGTVTIYAKTSNNKTATCIIRVNIPPKSISLNKTALTLNKGNRATLLVNFNPTNTTSKEVNWKSSNPNVVSVSNATTINGQITVIAKARGTAIITATHKYGKTAICKITVNDLSSNSITINLPKYFNSLQGGEIYNNRLFLFSAGGTCNVYNMVTNQYICTFKLPNGKDIFPHCNAVSFSKIFYNKTDKYPLLFVNAYNDAGIQDGTCYVYRLIVGNNEQFSCNLIHTIKIGFTDTNIWKNSKDKQRTYGNFVIDTDNNYMYVYNLRISENKTRFFKFKIPDISSLNKTTVINTSDIIETIDYKLINYIQDSCYYNGCLYILSGVDDSHLWKFDLKTKKVSEIALPKKPSNIKYFEPEAIGIYNGYAIVSFTDYGKIYIHKVKI